MVGTARRGAPSGRRRRGLLVPAVLVALVTLWVATAAAAPSPTPPLPVAKRWTGDLDGMVRRRQIRALVVYSKTFYFLDKGGTQRGTAYEGLKAWEEELNRTLKRGNLRVNVVFIPVSRDELLPALRDGRGDIAAANLTITPERGKLVAFSAPLASDVRELVVTGPKSPRLDGVDDLAGREVFVRRSSSYHESLVALNAELARAGKRPVRLRLAPETLEDEDLLEMVNAGLVPIVVVDSHKAEFWAQIFPAIRVHADVAVRTGGEIAWAFRQGSPKLKAAVDDFVQRHKKGTAFGNQMLQRYLRSTKWAKQAVDEGEIGKFHDLVGLFQRYGNRYDFDFLLLAAQAYQESQLEQSRRSPAGAIGVMQVLPATGREMKVGDIGQVEPNVHAGVKYLRFIADRYFKDPKLDPLNRTLFTFAAYNAGPAKVTGLRKEAARRGLDPDLWLNHVEVVAAQRIGRETVQYVSNIYKYYIAYRLVADELEERERAKESLQTPTPR